jgi:hypothetical protein
MAELVTNLLEGGRYEVKGPPAMINGPSRGNYLLPSTEKMGIEFEGDESGETQGHLFNALRTGEPNTIFTTLTKLLDRDGDGHRFLHLLPATMFSEILQSMDPNLFVKKHLKLYREISPLYLEYNRFNPDDGHIACRFYTGFINQILAIVQARCSAGLRLSLVDYKYLLRCARVGGSTTAFDAIWSAMLRDAMQPDTECYNHYLAAIVKADLDNRLQKQPQRAILYRPSFRERHTTSSNGIKTLAIGVFDGMVHNGIFGDEETFSLMMVALAREGEIGHVNGILAKVWNIDVGRLMAANGVDVKSAKTYELGSPFRPSESLLLAVAHSYGINNQIPTALRLIDFISRSYSIRIPTPVWEELLKWTFLLSLKGAHKGQAGDPNIGQLPPSALTDLWDTLIAEPYSVKPTITMYHDLIINLLRRQRFGEAAKRLQEARLIHMQNVHLYANCISLLNKQAWFSNFDGSVAKQRSIQSQARLLDLQREMLHRYQLMQRSRRYIKGLVRRYITRSSKSLGGFGSFSAVGLPEFMLRFKSYLPNKVKYKTATGEIVYGSQVRQRNRARVRRLSHFSQRPNLLDLWKSSNYSKMKATRNKKRKNI